MCSVNSVKRPFPLHCTDNEALAPTNQALNGSFRNASSFVVTNLSRELVEIFTSIRDLTSDMANPDLPGTHKQIACLEVQEELKAMESRTEDGSLNDACILASSVYTDIVLLQKSPGRIALSVANARLQKTILKPWTARDRKDNQDVLVWISSTADAAIGWSNSYDLQFALVDKFNLMVTRLEGLQVD